MQEPPWKKLKLSLERPYKDDQGEPIPVLLDITPDGQQVYEPREDPTSKLGDNLRRIFVERGHDFFDKNALGADTQKESEEDKEPEERDNIQPMTPEELLKMRIEIVPQLHIALGEMMQASDLLSSLLDKSLQPSIPGIPLPPPSATATPGGDAPKLRATPVTKPPPVQSVEAFNEQLAVGGKDKALRKASDLLKSASESVEQSRLRSERYWVDALKIRRGNWGLIPAPLPLGSATGKGADKTSKDFLVSFSLEESPAAFRRRAIGRIPTFDATAGTLEYPLRQSTRLQIAIVVDEIDGTRRMSKNTYRAEALDSSTLEGSLRAAQAEVVQQEIFSILIKEASNLSTAASARVSERLIVLEAAQGTELRFELVDNDTDDDIDPAGVSADPICELIFASLHVLLLRAHAHVRARRLGHVGVARAGPPPAVEPPPLLRPIVDLLQYRVFCSRVHGEVRKMVRGLRAASIPTKLWLNPVGESGERLVAMLSQADMPQKVGGEASIRIDDRRTLRFTYLSPSALTAHLPQANLTVGSISQLSQLLFDEVGTCLLERICEIANEMCESVHATWFVDLLTSRTIGRWEGRALNFHVTFAEDSAIICIATSLERGERHPVTHIESYTVKGKDGVSLLDWVRQTIDKALESSPDS